MNTYSCPEANKSSRSGTFPGVVLVFMPSLISRFRAAEREHGPLTSEQAEQIRQDAVGTFVSERIALEMERSRGFRDLDAENYWQEWQALKGERRAEIGQLPVLN